VKGFVVHLGELLSGSKTDHLKLRARLAEDERVREFLCHQVIDE
jgi:hypothetical protein